MVKKRGQEGFNAAYLMWTFVFILVVYLILLPSGEKQKLLSGPAGSGGIYGGPSEGPYIGGPGGRSILSEIPGTVYPALAQILSTPLGSMHLFVKEELLQDALSSKFEISNGLFGDEIKSIQFNLNQYELQNMNTAGLLFTVADFLGGLRILLNGEEIFYGEVGVEDLPIELPVELLSTRNNLEFQSSEPQMFGLFGKNFYRIKDAVLVKKVGIVQPREVAGFVLSETEYNNLAQLSLFFIINCELDAGGRLLIRMNGKVVHDREIVCDAREIEVGLQRQDLLPGRSVLEFMIDRGSYEISSILVEGQIVQERYPSYYFTLGPNEIGGVLAGVPIVLEMRLGQPGIRKVATIVVNGLPIYMDIYDVVFVQDITPLLEDGQNSIQILPDTSFDILQLNVFAP